MSGVDIYLTVPYNACLLDSGRGGFAKVKGAKSQKGKLSFLCWLCVDLSFLALIFLNEHIQWLNVVWIRSQCGAFGNWKVYLVLLVNGVCSPCLWFDLTIDWRVNLDVCGHTCGCLTAYCLASEICSEFSRLQGWWFEPCETFKASELNKKISRRAPEWYIGT